MELIQDNTITTIHFTEDQSVRDKVEEFLYDNLAAEVPGAQFSPQVKRGFWDGMVHFYDKKEHTFATGLTKDVTTLLEKVRFTYEFTFEVVDNRPDRFINPEDIPNEITLGGMTLRDYQMNAVKELFESGQGGIANLSVSAGKTLIGATVVDLVLERLQKGERIAFFTNNKEIFRQNIENLNKFLPEKVGYLGGGKKKMARVMVCMIPTVDSYLKIDPEAGLKFSPKEQQVKKMAKTYAPQFIYEEHPYQAFKSFVSLFKPIKKVDYTTQETLEDIRDSCGSDKDVVNTFNKYIMQYDKLVEKKASDSVKKKKFITDLLDSFVLFVADECLSGNAMVTMRDGSLKPISEVKKGDHVKVGGKVLDTIMRIDQTMTLHTAHHSLTGTLTHPVAVYKEDKVTFHPMMQVKVGDELVRTAFDGSLHPDKVTSIEADSGQTQVYDMTTETHMFIANGLLNHNCHHSKADTWYRVLLSCHNAIYKVGLSGSIDKDDPIVTTRLRGVFGGIVAKVGSKELVDRGILAKPTIVMIPINEPSTLAAVSTKGNGWQKIYKLGIEENEYRNTLIAGITKKQYESGKSTLIIVNRINQADIIGAYLDALSIPHEFINGQQDDEERKSELARVASGENRVLLSTSVLDEGVDISNIDTLILAAGGKSMRQVIQRIGRVLRKKKNKENKATIFDFEDNENQALRKHTKERLAIYQEQEFEVKYVGR